MQPLWHVNFEIKLGIAWLYQVGTPDNNEDSAFTIVYGVTLKFCEQVKVQF